MSWERDYAMLWGRRIMRREMVWARKNRNREGLAHGEGQGSDTGGHHCAGTMVCVFRKGQGRELLPSWASDLTQELMVTFHFMASAMFLQPTMPAVARLGEALLSTSVKSLTSHPETWGPIITLTPHNHPYTNKPCASWSVSDTPPLSSSPSSGWDSWTTTAS